MLCASACRFARSSAFSQDCACGWVHRRVALNARQSCLSAEHRTWFACLLPIPPPQPLSSGPCLVFAVTETIKSVPLQVADQLEAAVMHVLEQGYRTGDLMSDGMKQIGCSALGNVIEEYLQEA